MGEDLLELIAEGEAAIAELVAAGQPVPPDWVEYLNKVKKEAVKRGRLTAPLQAPPRYAPGCLFEYRPGHRPRPVLRCVSHTGCPREVVLLRPGLLAEMFMLEKLVGRARLDGEAEWLSRRRVG